jgi:hypothetical protein
MLNVTNHKTRHTRIHSLYSELLNVVYNSYHKKKIPHASCRENTTSSVYIQISSKTVPWLKRTDVYNLATRLCTHVQHSPHASRDTAATARKLQMIPLIGQLQSVCDLTCSLPWWQPATTSEPAPRISQCPLQPHHRPVAAL